MERLIMSMGTCLILVTVSVYCYWPPTIPRGGPKAAGKLDLDPHIAPLVYSARILSAPMGIAAGVFTTIKLHPVCLEWQGTFYGLGTSVLCGLIMSLLYSLGVDSIIEKRSSQWALCVGTFLAMVFGVYFTWIIGVVVG